MVEVEVHAATVAFVRPARTSRLSTVTAPHLPPDVPLPPAPLGVLPLGTTNNFARSLGLPLIPGSGLLAATVPHAERTAVADSFHSPQRENPQAWAGAVTDFLNRVDRAHFA
jgi:hypothetical protein